MIYTDLMSILGDIGNNFNVETFQILYKYVWSLPSGKFMELGTGWGRSTCAIAILNPKLDIYTIDVGLEFGSSQSDIERYIDIVQFNLNNHRAKQVNFNIADSRTFPWTDELVGLNIDSGHSYELTVEEIKRWTPFVKRGGLIFLDDYGPLHSGMTCGVTQAVDELLKNNPDYEDLEPDCMCQVYRKL